MADLYGPGKSHALELIRAGKVNRTAPWSFSAEDGDQLLGDPPDWTAYGAWHLGRDPEADRETKAAWKYPFGKNGEVYRSALRAIRTRAAQQGDTAISDAARDFMDEMDRHMADNRARPRGRGPERPWYRIIDQADPAVTELLIFDEIGGSFWSEGVTAKAFVDELAQLPEAVRTLRVRVNSAGGSVFDAIGIANALRSQHRDHQRSVEVSIEGLAASAATIVTSAGDVIRMADNALLMVHNPMGLVLGGAGDMRKVADMLDQVRDSIIATYQWVSPLPAEELSALMDATTWMSAEEAKAKGFVTEIVSGLRAAATVRPEALEALGAVPDAYRARVQALTVAAPQAPAPADPKAVIRACREAGLPELAEDLLGAQLDTVTARIAQVTAARDARVAREREIRALCVTAQLADLADGYLRSGMPVADIRAHLTTLTAKLGGPEIDGLLGPDEPARRGRPTLNTLEVYRTLNARPAPAGAKGG